MQTNEVLQNGDTMSNEMLAELRKMAEAGSNLSLEAGQRLTLGALADVYSTLHQHITMDQDIKDCMEDTNAKVDSLMGEITALKQATKAIQDNPFVSFGKHIRNHPKLALLYAIVGTILITWLPYVNLMRVFLLWSGIPGGVVDILIPAMGGK